MLRLALLPAFIVGAYLQSGELRTMLADHAPAPPQVTALYPRHRHLSSKVRLFINLLDSHLGQNPHWDLVG